MYSTCNPRLPTVMLPCINVILVFPASLPGFVSDPSSQVSQAGFVQTLAQSKLGLHHHSTSWALMCHVPVSAEHHHSLYLCVQRWEAALPDSAAPGAAECSRHRGKEAPGSLSSWAGRSSTGHMWLTGTFGPQQTPKDEFALTSFQPSGTSATSLIRKKQIPQIFPSASACLILLHVLHSTWIKNKKKKASNHPRESVINSEGRDVLSAC